MHQLILIKKKIFLKKNTEYLRDFVDINTKFIISELKMLYFNVFKIKNIFKK